MNNRQARILEEVLCAPGNDNCADCHAPAPRWASVNLGIFLCVQCASVHRKMGTHTSRVKSVTLDTWTREQVDTMRRIGNAKSNAHWNPNERLHPPPTNTGDVERDSELERYIRLKYEAGRFRQEAIPPRPATRDTLRAERPDRVNPELRDIITSRPKSSPLPDLPPEARPVFGKPAPPRSRPAPVNRPVAVDLVQPAEASTSTLPLQMAPSYSTAAQGQYQQQLQSSQQNLPPLGYPQGYGTQMPAQVQGYPQQSLQGYTNQTYPAQGALPGQHSHPFQMQQPLYQQQPQNLQQQPQFQPPYPQSSFQYPSFQAPSPYSQLQQMQGPNLGQQPIGSYYGGQLFNTVASIPQQQQQQQGFAQGMMPPR